MVPTMVFWHSLLNPPIFEEISQLMLQPPSLRYQSGLEMSPDTKPLVKPGPIDRAWPIYIMDLPMSRAHTHYWDTFTCHVFEKRGSVFTPESCSQTPVKMPPKVVHFSPSALLGEILTIFWQVGISWCYYQLCVFMCWIWLHSCCTYVSHSF